MSNMSSSAMRGAFAAVAITFSALAAQAADVKTVAVKSDSMKKEVKVVVITPSAYADKKTKFPVVYFLHGFSGDQTVWGMQSGLAPLADRYGMIFVSPDGAKSSWWIDSPVDAKMKYETFVSRELVKFIDSNYRTIADRRHRAITGESMGGHGALFNAIRHKDVFGQSPASTAARTSVRSRASGTSTSGSATSRSTPTTGRSSLPSTPRRPCGTGSWRSSRSSAPRTSSSRSTASSTTCCRRTRWSTTTSRCADATSRIRSIPSSSASTLRRPWS